MGMLSELKKLPLKKTLIYAIPYLLEETDIIRIIRQYLWSTLKRHWPRKTKVTIYEKIIALSGDFHENKRSNDPSDLISHLDNFEYLMVAVFFLTAPSLLDLVLSVHALHYHFDIGLPSYYSSTAAIYMWDSRRLLSQHESQQRQALESQRQERRILQESISNWPTVASFNRLFLHEQACFSKAINTALECSVRESLLSASGLITKDAFLTATLIAAVAAQQNRPVGDFIITWMWWTQSSTILGCLMSGIGGLKRHLVKLEPVIEVLDWEPSVLVEKDAPTLNVNSGDIKFENVTFSYDREQLALISVLFHVRGGHTTAIVGLSGSGKSTIFKLRLFDPQSGTIRVDDYDISRMDALREPLRRCRGCPSESRIFYQQYQGEHSICQGRYE